MDKMVYLAMSGARQTLLKQSNNNHNLANVNTTGFKSQMDSLAAVPLYGPGHPSRVYAVANDSGSNFEQGNLVRTGNALDIAIDGAGFIAVLDVDGSEAYTRAGDLKISAEGLLQNSKGNLVLGNGGPISVSPYDEITIGNDGTITIRPLGQSQAELAVVDRIKLVNPDTNSLSRNERGLFVSDEGVEPADGSVRVASESLESSNVNSVEALVTMIELSRQFETQVKMMNLAQENDAKASRLLQTS
ncbi:MAG: flagellar basal-body rod protein FlgF [Gammaproteobacteria bacterium]|nr:flagellar basal-body rod protein FlgF [Gammaproteobacteria bacterium]